MPWVGALAILLAWLTGARSWSRWHGGAWVGGSVGGMAGVLACGHE